MSEPGLVQYPKAGTIYIVTFEGVPYYKLAVFLSMSRDMARIKYVDSDLTKNITKWKEWGKSSYIEIRRNEIKFYDITTDMGNMPYRKEDEYEDMTNSERKARYRRLPAIIAYQNAHRDRRFPYHLLGGGRRRTKRVRKANRTRKLRKH